MKKNLNFGGLPMILSSEDERYTVTELSGSADDLLLLEVSADFGSPVKPAPFSLSFETDMTDLYATWRPCGMRDRSIRQWFSPVGQQSSFYWGSPLLACTDYRENNRLTAAVSDSVNPVSLSVWVDDLAQREQVGFRADFFGRETCEMSAYRAVIRLDRRKIPFSDAVREAAVWQNAFADRHDPVPEAAELPLYSSWYSFHQQPDQTVLERELSEAAAAGLRTLIVDDGWQFDEPNTGDYRFCGDWHVSKVKFPDFRRFTDLAHAHGIKVILWFAAPFVGYGSEVYASLKDKFLYRHDGFQAGVLDVRRPEVREFLLSTYERFIRDYGLDGIKLDFVDSFYQTAESPAFDPALMDCATVDDGVRALLGEIAERCRALKPDFLLEFRQNYVGPAVVSYGNMLRVGDCAFDPVTNRIGAADLRLFTVNTAVHSDMLFWSRKETPENVARQLCNILFAVPQISVILSEIPEEQKRVLKTYLAYWTENRRTLLHGTFRAAHPEANYTRLEAEDGEKKILALYAENTVPFDGKTTDVFAASGEKELIVLGKDGIPFRAAVYDCFGQENRRLTGEGLMRIPLPTAPAFVRLEKLCE